MEPNHPSSAEVQQQLARILASKEFTTAARLRRFLEYVVGETLAGRAERIKAYSIATSVLHRDDSFDPQVDPVVRIEAGRLRRALERYYLGSGRSDSIQIEIPKGAYVPRFTTRCSAPEDHPAAIDAPARPLLARRLPASAAGGFLVVAILALVLISWSMLNRPQTVEARTPSNLPSVLMLPISTADGDRIFAEGFTADILSNLSRYSEIYVFAPETSFQVGSAPDVVLELAEKYGARYVLRGSLTREDRAIHLGLQLLAASSDRIVWAESFNIDQDVSSVFAVQGDVARKVVGQIAEPYGAIGKTDLEAIRGKAPNSISAYECVLKAYDYRRRFDSSGYKQVQDCLQRAVSENPEYAEAWAMLALMYIDESRFLPMDQTPPAVLDLALEAAERAVDLAPQSATARRALTSIYFFCQQPEKGFAEGERALELNPNSAEVRFELGLRHVMSGDVQQGVRLIEDASRHNPAHPETYGLALALAQFRKGEFAGALATLRQVPARANFLYWAIASAIYGKAGSKDAKAAKAQLLKLYPNFPEAAIAEMRRRSIAADLMTSLVEGWHMAGIVILKEPNS